MSSDQLQLKVGNHYVTDKNTVVTITGLLPRMVGDPRLYMASNGGAYDPQGQAVSTVFMGYYLGDTLLREATDVEKQAWDRYQLASRIRGHMDLIRECISEGRKNNISVTPILHNGLWLEEK